MPLDGSRRRAGNLGDAVADRATDPQVGARGTENPFEYDPTLPGPRTAADAAIALERVLARALLKDPETASGRRAA